MASRGQKKFNRRLNSGFESLKEKSLQEETLLTQHPRIALKHFNREEWKIMKELEAAKVRYSPMRIKTHKAKVRINVA